MLSYYVTANENFTVLGDSIRRVDKLSHFHLLGVSLRSLLSLSLRRLVVERRAGVPLENPPVAVSDFLEGVYFGIFDVGTALADCVGGVVSVLVLMTCVW